MSRYELSEFTPEIVIKMCNCCRKNYDFYIGDNLYYRKTSIVDLFKDDKLCQCPYCDHIELYE